ncbi:MAG: ribonuclease M5 [Lactobacillaceae bacterium]|jgi:ribonuclease M5|nr:ribonuclease M5 [Lactobacillaceae bacterium]
MKIQEVIIVEGKADTAAIQQAVDADTIETTGSALPESTLKAIQTAAKTRGIIVFTDPDFNGERLRKMITAVVPEAKHAFLTKANAGALIKHHSLGIEYASQAAIQAALTNVSTAAAVDMSSDILLADLSALGLTGGANSAQLRTQVAEKLGLGYVNGKQLLKRLHMFGVTKAELTQTLKELN